ncbi:MAG: alkyl sulfatase dimerization domain-containing protein [Promethearchaeota archaeon]
MADKKKITGKITKGTFEPANILDFMGTFLKMINKSEECLDIIEGWNTKFQFIIKNGSDFWIKFEEGKLSCGDGNIDANITLTLTESNAVSLLSGQLNGVSAYMSGELQIQGNLADVQTLGRIIKIVGNNLVNNANKENLKETSLLWDPNDIEFIDPLKDIHTAILPISGCAWIETDEGVVLIDTMVSESAGKIVYDKIKKSGGTIKYIIYTHGHSDHVGGARSFIGDNPEIIANKYLPARLDKYKMLAPHRARIKAQQFNTPEIINRGKYVYPTKTFLGEMTISLGGKTFELHTARAETDDVCWVYVPELKAAFIGDLLIGSFPNIGNPWKPTRFALDWAKTLEKVRIKNADYIFFNGAGRMYKGKQVKEALNANIEVIYSLHDQVVEFINQDMHITEMIHKVKVPDYLKKSPYLTLLYSKSEFFVYNVYRWYHGYFDGNPAHLLPRPEKEVVSEIFSLIESENKIINRAKELFNQEKTQLSLQILDILIQAHPENVEARKFRIKLLKELGSQDFCLMSRNTWIYFIKQDKEFLKS